MWIYSVKHLRLAPLPIWAIFPHFVTLLLCLRHAQPQRPESPSETPPAPSQHSSLLGDAHAAGETSFPSTTPALEVPVNPTAFLLDHTSPYGPNPGHIRVTGKDIQGLPQAEAMLQAKHMEMV